MEDKPKRRTKKPANESQTPLEALETSGLDPADNANKKTGRPKKSRANNTATRAGTANKTLKGRVAKTGDAHVEKEKASLPSPSKKQDGTKESHWEENGGQLEEDMKRRLDWTPPKYTFSPVIDLNDGPSPGNVEESTNMRGFGTLLSPYNFYSDVESTARVYSQNTDGGSTKRKRTKVWETFWLVGSMLICLQLVPSGVSSHNTADTDVVDDQRAASAGKKPKKQNKRINTLTARVTAQYDDIEDDVAIGDGGSVNNLEIFRARKSKPEARDPELTILSPEAATQTLGEQDSLFATGSQLQRDDSPTTLTDTQMAIRASEADMFQEQMRTDRDCLPTVSGSLGSRSRSLWSIAARDEVGSVTQTDSLDVFDLSNWDFPENDHSLNSTEGRQWEKSPDADYHRDSPRENTSWLNESSVSNRRSPTSQTETKMSGVSQKPHLPMPQYTGFTDAELRRQIASYGFKPLKTRQKMIALLQKCWESKHGASTKTGGDESISSTTLPQSKETEKKAETTKPRPNRQAPPKKAPEKKPSTSGRGKKATSSSKPATQKQPRQPTPTREVEEIEDSEVEIISSPRRVQSRHSSSADCQPLPVRASRSKDHDTRRSSLPDLSTQITQAVRAQPRMSSSRRHPSWHEKILMYDPVILEHFATWLNTEGLGLVGEDREVGAGFVRGWCESKGICCCWKKGGI